jgi:hypothetical protein
VNCRGVLGPKTGGDLSKLQRAASTASNIVKSAKRKLKQVIGDGDDESSPKKKRRKTLPEVTKPVAKAKKQVLKTPAPAVAPSTAKMDLETQRKSRKERAEMRSNSLVTLGSKSGNTVTIRQSTSTYSLTSLQSPEKAVAQNKRQSLPLSRALSKGKSLASGSKAELKTLTGSLIKKGSASVQRTYGNRQSLLGALKSTARSTSTSKLLDSDASLRQSKLSFGGGSLSLQEPEPSTPVEPNTPVRSSKRTLKPSPKMIENERLAKAKADSARAGTSDTPVPSAKPTPKGSPNASRPSTPGTRGSKRAQKPSPKAKENELANKLKAVMRPGSSSASTDGSSSKMSMTKSLKSAATKGVKGSKLAAAKMRMSMKG